MLTKKELEVLNGLMKKDDFKGKKDLKHIIWRNTSTPLFKVGDKVKVSCRGMSICDKPVVNWTGTVTEVFSLRNHEEWLTAVEVKYIVNGKNRTSKVVAYQNEIRKADKLEVKEFKWDGKYIECVSM